jgi:hypothetical protein
MVKGDFDRAGTGPPAGSNFLERMPVDGGGTWMRLTAGNWGLVPRGFTGSSVENPALRDSVGRCGTLAAGP